jgi:hypothetical protein
MRFLRRWVTFAVLTLGFVAVPAHAELGFRGGLGPNPNQPGFRPGPGINAGYRPGLRGPIAQPLPIGPGPAQLPVVPVVAMHPMQQQILLMQQLSMHAKNMGDEISAINNIVASQNGARYVIDPRVVARMMADPYVNTLVRTTLTGTPPRTPRAPDFSAPAWRPQTIEYMVGWRAIDVFSSSNDWLNIPSVISMQRTISRFAMLVPDIYFYIEAMRETYIINPCMQWPNGELPAILARLEGQLFVMRQLMDTIYCNSFFHPYFPGRPIVWGGIEATFGAYRMDVRAPGVLPIAPFPYFADGFNGLGVIQPNFPLAGRPNAGPVLGAYNPQTWTGVDRVSPLYVDQNPIQGGANVPGLDGRSFNPVQIPSVGTPGIGNWRVGLPQNQPPGGGIPNGGVGGPAVGGPGAAQLPAGPNGAGAPGGAQLPPRQGQGGPPGQVGFDGNYGLGEGQYGPAAPQGQGGPQQGIPQQGAPQPGAPQQGAPQQQGNGQPQEELPNMPQQDPNAQPQTDNSSTGDGVVWGNFEGAQQPSQQQPPAGQQQR